MLAAGGRGCVWNAETLKLKKHRGAALQDGQPPRLGTTGRGGKDWRVKECYDCAVCGG